MRLLTFILIYLIGFGSSQAKSDYTAVSQTYADIAQAVYTDSLDTAKTLQKEIRKLVNKPTEQQLDKAKQAWLAARMPYSQSEVFRFANPIVDDWEGKVNAWPLDEGLIDYVVAKDNAVSTLNVIANQIIEYGNTQFDSRKITHDILEQLHELGDIETHVATGYHAIEFLLWGQDLNGVGSGAGQRPISDFNLKQCSDEHCFRRTRYLLAVVDLLVKDLTWMAKQWEVQTDNQKYTFAQGNDVEVFDVGSARNALMQQVDKAALASIIRGMGSLAYGELAGERMKLGLLLNDPEEEQDCFSDNTHWSHFYNLKGIENIFYGRYQRIDGSFIEGKGLGHLLAKDKATHQKLKQAAKYPL